MASDAPNTGARSRAPRNPTRDVPPQHTPNRTSEKAQAICVAAEAIDALVLAVECMIENQRGIMREANAGTFLCDNELWGGIAVLLTMVRRHAIDAGAIGEAMELATVARPAAA